MATELFRLLELYVRKMEDQFKIELAAPEKQPIFCKADGSPLEDVGYIVINTTSQVWNCMYFCSRIYRIIVSPYMHIHIHSSDSAHVAYKRDVQLSGVTHMHCTIIWLTALNGLYFITIFFCVISFLLEFVFSGKLFHTINYVFNLT